MSKKSDGIKAIRHITNMVTDLETCKQVSNDLRATVAQLQETILRYRKSIEDQDRALTELLRKYDQITLMLSHLVGDENKLSLLGDLSAGNSAQSVAASVHKLVAEKYIQVEELTEEQTSWINTQSFLRSFFGNVGGLNLIQAIKHGVSVEKMGESARHTLEMHRWKAQLPPKQAEWLQPAMVDTDEHVEQYNRLIEVLNQKFNEFWKADDASKNEILRGLEEHPIAKQYQRIVRALEHMFGAKETELFRSELLSGREFEDTSLFTIVERDIKRLRIFTKIRGMLLNIVGPNNLQLFIKDVEQGKPLSETALWKLYNRQENHQP